MHSLFSTPAREIFFLNTRRKKQRHTPFSLPVREGSYAGALALEQLVTRNLQFITIMRIFLTTRQNKGGQMHSRLSPNKTLDFLSFSKTDKKVRNRFPSTFCLSIRYVLRFVKFETTWANICKPPFGCCIFAVGNRPSPCPSQGEG